MPPNDKMLHIAAQMASCLFQLSLFATKILFVITKISKTVATRAVLFGRSFVGWGFAPYPTGGAYSGRERERRTGPVPAQFVSAHCVSTQCYPAQGIPAQLDTAQ